ncbi:membrane protein containing Acyltransferase 3 domain protein, partial [Candidatus Thiomargarita nelsonii]
MNVAWWSLNLIESLSIWAVPGFIMLSGALLLSPNRYDEPATDFYRKRITRIGIPFLFWVGAYLTWEKWRQGQPLSIDYVIQSIISSDVSWHLFFLFIIVGLYIMTPWVRLWVKWMSSRDELSLIISLLTIMAVGDIINRYLGHWGWNAATRWIPYLGYYIAGHYIVYHAPKKLGIYVLLFIVGFLGNIIGKYIEIRLAAGSIGMFYNTNYLSITMIPLAIGIFGII